ncbi:MAG: phosphoesterase PA-phosphatase related protein [Actinomycetia bacterium]|nr:phosphoesterase PA-phosphatase related protein [Actinomycetes bacterium]
MSNDDLFRLVNGFSRHTRWLHGPMAAYATYGVGLFAALLVVGWWFARGHGPAIMAAALWAPLGAVLAVVVNQPIVNAVDQRRPYAALPHVLVLVHRTTDPSAPSDHVTVAGAVAVGLFFAHRRLGLIAAAAAILMGVARVYVGVHYPGDVLSGLLLGGIVTMLGFVLAKGPLVYVVTRLRTTQLRPLVAARG